MYKIYLSTGLFQRIYGPLSYADACEWRDHLIQCHGRNAVNLVKI